MSFTSSTAHTVLVAAAGTPVQPSHISEIDNSRSRIERGKIVGWPGGDAVIYPTFGLFGAAQILAA
jgi:hypothetical protein